VSVATSVTPTPERLVCASCSHYVLLHAGAHWDQHAEPLCSSCASCAGLLDPRRAAVASAAAAAEDAAIAEEAIASTIGADLSSAVAHIRRLLRGHDERASTLRAQMTSERLDEMDLGAAGVLAAFDEAGSLLSDEGDGNHDSARAQQCMRAFDELVRRWEAQVPTGLLRLLHGLGSAPAPAPPAPMPPPPGRVPPLPTRERVRALRRRYAHYFSAWGVDGAAQSVIRFSQ
jgi:hypothetical protein